MGAWRGLLNILGGAAILLGLLGLAVQAQSFFGIYSEPVRLVTSYFDLVPLFSFITGVALVLGANVARGRKSRTVLLVATVAVLGYFAWGASVAMSAPIYGAFPQLQAYVTSCTPAAGPAPPETCSLVLTSAGTTNVGVTGACSLTFGGRTYPGTTSAKPTVQPGGSVSLACVGPSTSGAYAPPGSQVAGSVFLTDGRSLPFSGTGS